MAAAGEECIGGAKVHVVAVSKGGGDGVHGELRQGGWLSFPSPPTRFRFAQRKYLYSFLKITTETFSFLPHRPDEGHCCVRRIFGSSN